LPARIATDAPCATFLHFDLSFDDGVTPLNVARYPLAALLFNTLVPHLDLRLENGFR